MDTTKIMPAAIAAAICFGIYKYVANPAVKTAALGALGVIVAKNVPFVQDALA